MAEQLFSSSWYRISALRPRLRRQARIVRHTYRGERWYVLQDLASGRFLRLDEPAYRVVALMDGLRSVEQIWLQVCGSMGDRAPTQDDLLGLLSQLHQANVLLTERQPDLEELDERRRNALRTKLKQYIGNPLALKFPLLDPDRFLTALVSLFPRGSERWLLALWVLLVGSALFAAALHWEPLTSDITARVFTAENVFLLWLAFPLLKAIHELGHGLAIKAYGGSCREMGLMFLIMVPVPYVDASSTTAFPDKRQRMVVGLAGMLIELAVAALAMWLWVWVSPGVGKAFLHQILILASVTTVLFNINPLLRFDGYYVLADWLEIPNLGQKANRYLGYLVQHHVFKVGEPLVKPSLTPREGPWLVAYSIGSFVYRIMISVLIVLTVAEHFFFIGVLLALWTGWSSLIKPVLKLVRHVLTDPVLDSRRPRALVISGGFTLIVVLMLAVVPAPSWTMAEGVIWMPEQARLRSPHPCFGHAVLQPPGSLVEPGMPLLSCTDPELESELAQAASRVAELEARRALAITVDRVQLGIMDAELGYLKQKQSDLEARRAAMVIRSSHAGRFVMDAPGDFQGSYADRGTVLGYVLDPAGYTLLTVVPQSDVDLVRTRTQSVELRSVGKIHEQLAAEIVREVPAATKDLPSMALALQGGGRIGLDPDSPQEPKALASLFQFEMRFSGEKPQTLGNRVHVRFVHFAEPLVAQWYRSVRQVFLKRFAV